MPKLLAAIVVVLVSLMLATNDAKADPVLASCYGAESGGVTASGSAFEPSGFTAAHPSLPFGTLLKVSYGDAWVIAEVTDRGPFAAPRGLDLSMGACDLVGLTMAGVDGVDMEVIG